VIHELLRDTNQIKISWRDASEEGTTPGKSPYSCGKSTSVYASLLPTEAKGKKLMIEEKHWKKI
jgi:hypothetical protein